LIVLNTTEENKEKVFQFFIFKAIFGGH